VVAFDLLPNQSSVQSCVQLKGRRATLLQELGPTHNSLREFGVLCQEAVARMNRCRATRFRGGNDGITEEIGFGARRRAQAHRLGIALLDLRHDRIFFRETREIHQDLNLGNPAFAAEVSRSRRGVKAAGRVYDAGL
jgi:hypothetical protein